MSIKETNILKAFGVILMYFHHLFYMRENFQGYDIRFLLFSENQVIKLSMMCKVCVAIFVFATAYGTTKSLNIKSDMGKSKLSEYAVGRYLKLMSGFWFIWFVAEVTSFIGDRYRIYGEDWILRIKYIIIDFFGGANLLGTPTLNATWWYMTFAILLVFLMPILWLGVKRIGIGTIVIVIFLPRLMGLDVSSTMIFYLFTIVVGILVAEYGWIEQIKERLMGKSLGERVLWIACFALVLAVILYARNFAVSTIVVSMYDGIFSLVLAMLCVMISDMPVIAKFLELIGKHSMNMFLIHTFIKAYYFQDFSYQWKYPILILVVLLADTLGISMVIEWIKKMIGYNRLADWLVEKSKCAVRKIGA